MEMNLGGSASLMFHPTKSIEGPCSLELKVIPSHHVRLRIFQAARSIVLRVQAAKEEGGMKAKQMEAARTNTFYP